MDTIYIYQIAKFWLFIQPIAWETKKHKSYFYFLKCELNLYLNFWDMVDLYRSCKPDYFQVLFDLQDS
jgi:hypothetical protein